MMQSSGKTCRGNEKACLSSLVIPGRRKAASPESITTIMSMDCGLAPRGAPRNDDGELLFDM